MVTEVTVLDVSVLSSYAASIQNLKTELERSNSDLFLIFDSMRTNISTLTVLTNSQKKNWMDSQFDDLQLSIEQCINGVNSTSSLLRETALTVNTQLGEIEKSIAYVDKLVKQLEEINARGSSGEITGGHTRHLSVTEVSSRWETAVQSINKQIENYREALNRREVPN